MVGLAAAAEAAAAASAAASAVAEEVRGRCEAAQGGAKAKRKKALPPELADELAAAEAGDDAAAAQAGLTLTP